MQASWSILGSCINITTTQRVIWGYIQITEIIRLSPPCSDFIEHMETVHSPTSSICSHIQQGWDESTDGLWFMSNQAGLLGPQLRFGWLWCLWPTNRLTWFTECLLSYFCHTAVTTWVQSKFRKHLFCRLKWLVEI